MSKLIRQEIVVSCTPEQAFDYLTDMRNELEWNPDFCESMEKITDGPIGVDTRFRAKWKGGPVVEVEISHFDRPHTWRARNGGGLESRFEGSVEPHPDGAKVVTELELIPHGFFKLVFPIFKIMFNKEAKTTSERIRQTMNKRFAASKAAA